MACRVQKRIFARKRCALRFCSARACCRATLFTASSQQRWTKSFAKLLGYGGALLEATAEAARAKMAVYAADPQGFGRSQVAAKEAVPDLAADLAGYAMVEGFQNKGDGLAPGVKARWTVADAGAAPEPERAKQ